MDTLARPRSSTPLREEPGDHLSQRRRLRPFILGLVVLGGVALAWGLGIHDILRMENLARLRRWVEGYGPRGPALFISDYVLLEMAFVPALPLTVLGGLVFGPVWGTAYVSIDLQVVPRGFQRDGWRGGLHPGKRIIWRRQRC